MEIFHRQQDILTPEHLRGCDVDIVGGGALGGAIALGLLKSGFGIVNRLTVTDFDRCELHNLPTQFFRRSHVALEQSKVEALAEMALWVCDTEIETVCARFTGMEERRLGPVVIIAVDSLEERKAIWGKLQQRSDVEFLLDARMGAEILDVYCLDRKVDSTALYEASLEGVAHEEPCTRRAVMYTALGAAAFVGSILRAYVRNEPYPRHVTFDFRNFLMARTRDDEMPGGLQADGRR